MRDGEGRPGRAGSSESSSGSGDAAGSPGGGSRPRIFRLSRRAGRAYQGALEAVLAIPIGMGLGYGADALLGSRPVGLLLGLGLGFAAFVIRVVRLRGLLEADAARDADESQEGGPEGRRE